MNKHMQYLSYVLRHKWYVFVEGCRLGVPWLGLIHDMSKFRPDEWIPYARYFYGNYPELAKAHGEQRNLMLIYNVRTKAQVAQGFDAAWLKHIHRNKHHWQWWILREDDGDTKMLEMPLRYHKEMLADWRGAGKALGFGDNTATWYEANKDKMQLGPDTRKWIEGRLSD